MKLDVGERFGKVDLRSITPIRWKNVGLPLNSKDERVSCESRAVDFGGRAVRYGRRAADWNRGNSALCWLGIQMSILSSGLRMPAQWS